MGDRDIRFRIGADAGEAKGAFEEVVSAIGGLKTASADGEAAATQLADAEERAEASAKGLASGVATATQPLSEMDSAAKRAAESLKKLSDPETSPRKLQIELVRAATAIDQMKAAIEATRATGGVVSQEMLAKLSQYEAALATGVKRVGEMRDRIGDLRTQGALSAQSMETLSGRLGSFQSALGLAADAQSSFISGLAKVGLAAIAFKEALVLAKVAADAIKEASKALGDEYVRLATQTATLNEKQATQVQLLNAIKRGYIDTKTSTNEASGAAEQYGTKLAAQAKAGLALSAILRGDIPSALQALRDAFNLNDEAGDKAVQKVGELQEKWKSYLAEQQHGKQIMDDFAKSIGAKIPESFEKAREAATNWNRALSDAFEQSYSYAVEFVRKNKDEIERLIQAYKDYGQEVPEYLKKAQDVMKDDVTSLNEHTKASNDNEKAVLARAHAYAKANEAALKLADAVKKAIEAAAQEVAAAQKSASAARSSAEQKIKALNEEGVKGDEYWKRKKAILAEETAAVDAATEKENAARKKAGESLEEIGRDYGVNAEQVKKALEVQKTYTEALDSASKSQGNMKELSGQLVDALARQRDGVNEMTPAFESWNKAIDAVGTKQETVVIPALGQTATKAKELGTGMDEAARFAGELGTNLSGLPSKLDETATAANRAAEAMRNLAQAQREAS